MSDGFVAGFAVRHAVAAETLQAAFAPPMGFAAVDPCTNRRTDAAESTGPKHFRPADPSVNPTAGWDMLDPCAEPVVQIDPLEAAHAAGFAEGLATANAAAQAEQARDRALIDGVAGALGARIDRDAIAAQLRQTVLALVTRLVGEAGIDAERLATRVGVAAEMLADAQESAMLRVHPADVALLDGRLPATIFAVGDAQLARGSFVLESASTVVEDGPALWLEQLSAAIDRAPLPVREAASC